MAHLSQSAGQKLCAGLLVFCALVSPAHPAFADVTGSFGTHLLLIPQTNGLEFSPIEFDLQNQLNVTAVISGLSATFHTHFGIAGREDAIVGANAALGILDLQTEVVFGRFLGVVPFYDDLHFIGKITSAEVSLGGISIYSEAQLADTNAFISQSAAYAFGERIGVAGQTPSGVGIEAETGFCLAPGLFAIKKHVLSLFAVNRDCAQEPKPDILFDYERLSLTGLPLAPSVSASAELLCEKTNPCTLDTRLFISNMGESSLRLLVALKFSDLLKLNLSTTLIQLFSDGDVFTISLSPTGEIQSLSLFISGTLNPENNPATLAGSFNIVPGQGLTSALLSLGISRQSLSFSLQVFYRSLFLAPARPVSFTPSLRVSPPGGLWELVLKARFDLVELSSVDAMLTLHF